MVAMAKLTNPSVEGVLYTLPPATSTAQSMMCSIVALEMRGFSDRGE